MGDFKISLDAVVKSFLECHSEILKIKEQFRGKDMKIRKIEEDVEETKTIAFKRSARRTQEDKAVVT